MRVEQTSFTAGELNPQLAARIDVSRYYSGAEKAENVFIRPQGGATRRPGFVHVADLPAPAALVPFAFNTEQLYLVVLVADEARVFKDDALVATVTGAPWTADMVPAIRWTQSADTLILTHVDMPPQRLVRQGSHSAWSLDAVPLDHLPGHDFGAVTPAGTLTPSAVTGDDVTITASQSVFPDPCVGWYVVAGEALARITARASATEVTVDVLRDFPEDDQGNPEVIAADDWLLEEPVISAARGWPRVATFYQGRLYFGGLRSLPATLIGSRVSYFFDFDPGGALDDDGIKATIDTDQVNAIQSFAVTRGLHVFTTGAEFLLSGGTEPVITPAARQFDEQTRRGIMPNVAPVEVDGALYFAARGGRAIREHLYNEVEAAYGNTIVSLLAAHLIDQPVDMAARKGAASDDTDVVAVAMADGTLAVLTVLRAQDVVAWAPWTTDGAVQRLAALDDGTVYWAVERAGTLRLERWDAAAWLDAAVVVTAGLPTSTVTGLDHLEGREVKVVVDGAVHPPRTVSGGAITLDYPAKTEIQVGLPFAIRLRTMPAEPRLRSGTRIGQKTRTARCWVRVLETGPFTVNGVQMVRRRFSSGETLDQPPPRVTGDLAVSGLRGWGQAQVEIAQDEPQPFTVLAVAQELAV